MTPLTTRVPPVATDHVWLEARPTLALMVLAPLTLVALMPLPAVLPLALVASMVSIFKAVLAMVTPLALKLRLLMSKSAST